MGSHDPDVAEQKQLRARALEIGNTLDASAVDELLELLKCRFPEVRRLAASALGKLAPRHPNEVLVAESLAMVAETDDHPQVRQYALKSLSKYPEASISLLDRLRDLARDPDLRDYVRAAAAEAVAEAQKANRKAYARKHHWCTRCHRRIGEEEFMRGMELFGKPYCLHCLDERILESKNFELVVDDAKTKRTEDGTAVQSQGERRICDFSLRSLRPSHLAIITSSLEKYGPQPNAYVGGVTAVSADAEGAQRVECPHLACRLQK